MGKLLIYLKYVFLVFSADIKEKRMHVHVRDSKGRLTNLCKQNERIRGYITENKGHEF